MTGQAGGEVTGRRSERAHEVRRATPVATQRDPAQRSPAGPASEPDRLGNRATVGLLDRAADASPRGDPLPDEIRRPMAAALGDPLGDVRVRTDADAAARAGQLRAAAFTEGRQIAFAPGRYRPDTPAGRRLLVHEVVHTAQNRWLSPTSPITMPRSAVSRPTDPSERQAHSLAATLAPSLASARSALAAPAVAFSPVAPTALVQRAGEDEVDSDAAGMTSKSGASVVGTAPPPVSENTPPAAPVEPGGPTIVVDGVTLSESPAYVRKQLLDYITAQGTTKAEELQQHLEESVTTQGYDLSDQSGASDEQQKESESHAFHNRILGVVKAELGTISKERAQFLSDFQQAAEKNVRMILDQSEDHVLDEMDRYGIVRTTKVTEGYSYAMKEKTSKVTTTNRMGDNAETKGLAGAARELAAKRRAVMKLESSRMALESIAPGYGEYGSPGRVVVKPENQPEYQRLGEEITKAEKDYDLARAVNTEDFPILAAFADTRDPETLEKLAGGSSQSNADILGEEISKVLENIRTVRDGLGTRFSIWKQRPVVDATKPQFADIPWQGKWVDEEVTRVEEDAALTDLMWTALAIGLGLLAAIPSGGSSLVAAGTAVAAVGVAGVSGYLAFQHALDYNMAAAAAKTDFDKARAISQDEPSLFWLALDIVGAALDLGAAAKAFKAAVGVRRTVLAKEVLDDAAIKELKAAGNKIGEDLAKHPLPNLGNEIVDEAIKRRSLDTALEDAAKDANALAEGGKVAEAGTAAEKGGALSRATQGLKAVMADVIERIRTVAEKVWAGLGFRYFTVELKGEWMEIYGHHSPGRLVARFKFKDTLLEKELVTEGELLAGQRSARAKFLDKAANALDEQIANKMRSNAIRETEKIGEQAGEQVVRSYYKELRPRRIFRGHGSGVLDLVYELEDGTIIILEAKGGTGRIGRREVAAGEFATQGSRRYLTSILDNMEKDYPDVVAKIRAARKKPGGLKYLYSSTPIPADPSRALTTTLKEFTL
nr:DUF4157 domain-containing protein [Mycobacterium sp. UM_NZ2]